MLKRQDEMTSSEMVPFALLSHGIALAILLGVAIFAPLKTLLMLGSFGGICWLAGGQAAVWADTVREEESHDR